MASRCCVFGSGRDRGFCQKNLKPDPIAAVATGDFDVERLAGKANYDDFSGQQRGQDCENSRRQRSKIDKLIRAASKHKNAEGQSARILLGGQVLIDGDERIEPTGDPGEQLPVGNAGPTSLRNRGHFVPD